MNAVERMKTEALDLVTEAYDEGFGDGLEALRRHIEQIMDKTDGDGPFAQALNVVWFMLWNREDKKFPDVNQITDFDGFEHIIAACIDYDIAAEREYRATWGD